MLVLDEHGQRDTLVTEAAMAMYNSAEPRRCLIEPPFQVESHRYQTMQAADWIRVSLVALVQSGRHRRNILKMSYSERILRNGLTKNLYVAEFVDKNHNCSGLAL